MKYVLGVVGVLAVSAAGSVYAQMRPTASDNDYGRWNDQATSRPQSWLPFTSYGYLGAGLGEAVYDHDSCAAGFACDRRDTAGKIFLGGMFSRILGAEIAYVNTGEVDRNGGDSGAQGINLSVVGNLPVTDRLGLFAKAGTIYGWTRTSATAPSVATGHENGFNFSYGAGAQFELNRNWALRADWDRYRFKYTDRRDDVNVYTLNALYKF